MVRKRSQRNGQPGSDSPRERAGSGGSGADLAGYEAKRDFANTPEPRARNRGGSGAGSRGRGRSGDGPPRFVIHEHHASRLHWDLRLEHDGALRCWAIPKALPEAPGENHFAAATEEHPLEYLDFHGEIPAGQYGAGRMTIWDRGSYEVLKWDPRKVEVALHGERLNARYALFQIGKEDKPEDWMIHRMDPPEDPRREPMPSQIKPMNARAGSLPREDGGWAYEVKWDGVRALAYSRPGELRLESRNLLEITDSYPELASISRALGSHSAVLDGEIVALDGSGRPSFAALQGRMHVSARAQARRLAADTPVTYMIFDLLWLDGHPLLPLPYSDRRELLAALAVAAPHLSVPEHVVGDGAALLQASGEQGLEGILAKRLDSPYQPGVRTSAWVKIKSVARQEFVVGGWIAGKGKRAQSIGALLLGVHDEDGALRYAGRVGSGLSDDQLERLAALLTPIARRSSPFASGERPPRDAHFCAPEVVVEVQFAHWTEAGSLRQPTYKGLREDKPASEVVREDTGTGFASSAPENHDAKPARHTPPRSRSGAEGSGGELGAPLSIEERTATSATTIVAGHEVKLSNLAKLIYPASGFDKRALIDYYAAVAPVLLGHLAGRALTVTRWPDGVEGKSFFQKQSPAHRPEWVRTATVHSRSKDIDYTLADDLGTLVWLANLAAIELHTPLARAATRERPTVLVFDLDPGAPASIIECCHVALQLQGMFANLGLESFAKTSGSKGLQVYIPLNRDDADFAQTKGLAKAVAELLEGAEADLVVSRMTKDRREGKVLIDWSQNDANKTTVCAYSLRAGPRPTVSTPLSWDEVRAGRERGEPASLSFEAAQVLERVREQGDLFAPVLSLVQELPSF